MGKKGTNSVIVESGESPPIEALAIHSTRALNGEIMQPFEIQPLKQARFGPRTYFWRRQYSAINLLLNCTSH